MGLSSSVRISHLQQSTHVILVEDSTVHVLKDVTKIGDAWYVETLSGFIFRVEDVFSLDEAYEVETFYQNHVKPLLKI